MVVTVESDGHLRPVKEEGGLLAARRRPLDAPACASARRDTSRIPRIS
jgi:hypothetical protein